MNSSATEIELRLSQLGITIDLDRHSTGITSAESILEDLISRGEVTPFQANVVRGRTTDPLVLSDYILKERLGGGGMGVVYKARHRYMDRTVALKLIRPEFVADQRAVDRFQRECRAAAKLHHPNIVTAFDGGVDGERHFLVMEYLEGENLLQIVQRGPLSLSRVLSFILQAGQGLEHMHQRGVVHRDIKPSNLMCVGNEVVKILDVGLARLVFPDSETPTSAETLSQLSGIDDVFGTVDFMSPEQAFDSCHVDRRADIYSLGCTLHVLLTGKVVYPAESSVKKLIAHREGPIPSLRSQSEIPDSVERVFQRMLQKNPADRYPEMRELIHDLQSCMTEVDENIEKRGSSTTKIHMSRPMLADLKIAARKKAEMKWIWAGAGFFACVTMLAAWLAYTRPLNQTIPAADFKTPSPEKPDPGQGPISRPLDKPVENAELTDEETRSIATWLMEIGGIFKILCDGLEFELSRGSNLPKEPFRITSIELPPLTKLTEKQLIRLTGIHSLNAFRLNGMTLPPQGWARLHVFTELKDLNLFDCKVTDSDLEFLANLTQIERLQLGYTQITDDGLDHLRGLKKLTELRLMRTAITDAGLEKLKDLSQIRRLDLGRTQIKGTSFDVLLRFPDLEELSLTDDPITDESLATVARCPKLYSLGLARTPVSDAGLEFVGQLNGLTMLSLDKTQITSAGLAKLSALTNLSYLEICENQIDDAGLLNLTSLRNLRTIRARMTSITPEGVTSLTKQIPLCTVDIK